MKKLEDTFTDWYNTVAIRTYSPNHGTAKGHEDYARNAFLGGFYAGLEHFKQLLENDQTEVN